MAKGAALDEKFFFIFYIKHILNTVFSLFNDYVDIIYGANFRELKAISGVKSRTYITAAN